MNIRKGQFTKTEQIHKPISKAETDKLAQSCNSISKRGILSKGRNSIKGNGLDRRCNQTKDTTPRLQVSVEFAADQWLRILLVYLNSKNSNLKGVIEPLPGAFCV